MTSDEKNRALSSMADALTENTESILKANRKDMENAENSLTDVMKDRLFLDEKRVLSMADGIKSLIPLNDPVNEVISSKTLENGLKIDKIRVPLGVVAIIYESRPNVTSDAAALCLKSGNVSVLKCGREAINTSVCVAEALRSGLGKAGFNPDIINIVESTDRADANALMTANGYVDLLIPRGGAGLINACVKNATVPCIQTGTGICHIYVDKDADFKKALDIIENAKLSRPSVCNACEVCLVHRDIAKEFLPLLKERLTDRKDGRNAELRLDDGAFEIIGGRKANDTDFDTEFLDYILAVKIVSGTEEAIKHIAEHSTHHSEAIISENEKAQQLFCASVDSAAVYINASTRFTDGGEFGLGCEMGISTQKLHARGPMGLKELTSYKYVITGQGQVR